MSGDLRFVAATPVWWQAEPGVSFCLELGGEEAAAVTALAEVATHDGALPEVLMLVSSPTSPASEAVQDWLLEHLWLPALVLAGEGGPEALVARARTADVRAIPAPRPR